MSTGIGNKIKYYRIKENMTQEELAIGVVSVSYLSKIEHDSAEANPEVIHKLCEKLNIKPVRMHDEAIYTLSKQWHKELLQQDIAKAKATYPLLKDEMEKIIDANLYWLTELHCLYYYTVTNQHKEATKIHNYLERHHRKFNEEELYYWCKFSGYYYYHVDLSYLKAYRQLIRAEKLISLDIENYKQDIHDLYYLIAEVSTKLYFTYHTMVYANKALEYYRSNYELKRCVECQLIKGIAYKRMNEIERSEKSFNLAFSILNKYQDEALLATCHLELGDLYNRTDQPTKAITYFKKSYYIAEEKVHNEQFKAMIYLMKIYLAQDELEHAKAWYKAAEAFVQDTEGLSINYVYDLKAYYYLIYGFDQTFEVLMEKTILPFLKQKEQYKQYSTYMFLMADYYYQNRKYKLAADNYKKAHKAINHIQIKDNL